MKNINIRRRIALEAARLLLRQEETDLAKARARAAMRFAKEANFANDLPGFAEIESQLRNLSRASEPQLRRSELRELQTAALDVMRSLAAFSPRLVGDPAFGFIYRGREIRIEILSDSLDSVRAALRNGGIDFVESKSHSNGSADYDDDAGTLVLRGRFPVLLNVLITAPSGGETPEPRMAAGIGVDALDALLRAERPEDGAAPTIAVGEDVVSPIQRYRKLLAALEFVRQDGRTHPEGDALYHSLQVFELAWQSYPYDEEFLLAALLHDVGKAIDPRDHVKAGLRAIEDCTSPRTRWFVENLPLAKQWLNGSVGRRLRARLESHPDFEQLIELARLDRQGRKVGAKVRDLESVLADLERLAREND